MSESAVILWIRGFGEVEGEAGERFAEGLYLVTDPLTAWEELVARGVRKDEATRRVRLHFGLGDAGRESESGSARG